MCVLIAYKLLWIAAILTYVIIAAITSLFEEIKISITKLVAECYAEGAHIPSAVRVLVKIFGIIYSTPATGIKDVVDIERKGCFFIPHKFLAHSKISHKLLFRFTLRD